MITTKVTPQSHHLHPIVLLLGLVLLSPFTSLHAAFYEETYTFEGGEGQEPPHHQEVAASDEHHPPQQRPTLSLEKIHTLLKVQINPEEDSWILLETKKPANHPLYHTSRTVYFIAYIHSKQEKEEKEEKEQENWFPNICDSLNITFCPVPSPHLAIAFLHQLHYLQKMKEQPQTAIYLGSQSLCQNCSQLLAHTAYSHLFALHQPNHPQGGCPFKSMDLKEELVIDPAAATSLLGATGTSIPLRDTIFREYFHTTNGLEHQEQLDKAKANTHAVEQQLHALQQENHTLSDHIEKGTIAIKDLQVALHKQKQAIKNLSEASAKEDEKASKNQKKRKRKKGPKKPSPPPKPKSYPYKKKKGKQQPAAKNKKKRKLAPAANKKRPQHQKQALPWYNTLRPWKILSGVLFSIFSLEATYIGYHHTSSYHQWGNATCPSSPIDANPTNTGGQTLYQLLKQSATLQNQSLLHKACLETNNITPIKKYVEEDKIDVNQQDGIGRTPLMNLMFNGRMNDIQKLTAIQYLFNNSADINIQTYDGITILMLAVQRGKTQIVQYLCSSDADLNLQNKYNETALMYAAFEGNAKMVALLLNNGANSSIRDIKGRTAISYGAKGMIAKVGLYPEEKPKETARYKRTMETLLEGNNT